VAERTAEFAFVLEVRDGPRAAHGLQQVRQVGGRLATVDAAGVNQHGNAVLDIRKGGH